MRVAPNGWLTIEHHVTSCSHHQCRFKSTVLHKMGFILPAPYSPREQARALMTRKQSIEADLDAQVSILRANNATLQSPLVDSEGFPRDDLGTDHSLFDRFQSSL